MPADKPRAKALVATIGSQLAEIAPYFPQDAAYLAAVRADLAKWIAQDLGVPDFLDSLNAVPPGAASGWTAASTWSCSRCTPRTAARTATWKPFWCR